jgi:hypothetical protein
MRRALAITAVLGAGALALVTLPPRHEARAPDEAKAPSAKSYEERELRELAERRHERRRVRPNVYRASAEELALRNRVVAAEAAKVQARERQLRLALAPSVPGQTWVPLGPTDAIHQYNAVLYNGVDSGRPSAILVDPRDSNIVYVAVSGGGVWKTFDFLSPTGPTWMPLTDTQPNMAVGSLAMDPANPDKLYLASGDAFDVSGNTVQTSSDGGGSWSTPVTLAGTYPAPNSFNAAVRDIRSLAVQGTTVLAGTNVGLFRSTDGGASFTLVDLPNPAGRTLTESIWSVVSVGGGAWVVSGVTGCSDTSGPPPIYQGAAAGTACPAGNYAAIWRSTDGATWTQVTVPAATGTGRVTLAAGGTANPATTPVYAYVGATDGLSTLGFWRSLDGGKTWANATGTLANPTLVVPGGSRDCESTNLGHDQTWYNQAIVVDPTNPDHVLAGGNLCGARTLNGTSATPKWELVSHWLPDLSVLGTTANGKLPYVHADWHTGTIAVMNGVVRAFAGSDGGIFASTDVFTKPIPEQTTWTHYNRGLATHLIYSVASGDPVTMNPFVLYGGLQDNGTRFRTSPTTPTVFNQPVGGDGIGATVHASTLGTVYWASVEFGHMFCRPSASVDCAEGQNWVDTMSGLPVRSPDSPEEIQKDIDYAHGLPAADDSEPFLVHYANVETDTAGQSVLTHTTGQIWVVTTVSSTSATWKAISQDLTNLTPARGFSNVIASRTIPGLYGAVGDVSAFPFYYSTTGNTLSTWVVSQPVRPTGTTERLTGPSSMDFPPVTPPGKTKGQVYIGSFVGTLIDPATSARRPPPDDKGRLYRTTDAGQTWTSIVGADPAHRLPNVPVYVVKYDPVTPTTIYAGTDIGMYISLDDGATWDRMGDGFPMVPVRDMYIAKNQEFIRVATYGRGFWEIYPSAMANQGVFGNGDYDRNLRIDWVDLAAMASRQGVSPAIQTAPFYTWLLDMTGMGGTSYQSIDGSDLDALLKKFGGHP